ncbi:MAG TPA: MASE1 domain-containing protein [Longimicrobiales bacterium]
MSVSRLPIPAGASNPSAKPAGLLKARNLSAASGGAILLMVAYYLGARVGFVLQSPTVPQSILWLPNSILLSALLLAPKRHWPIYFVVAFPAHLAVAMHADAPLLTLSILYLTNWLDAALGATLVLHYVRQPVVLSKLRNMLLFLGLAATLATLLVSFVDAGITVLMGWGDHYWEAWSTRVRSNMLTNVVWVPTVLGLRELIRHKRRVTNRPTLLRAGALVLVTAALAFLAFSYPPVERSPGLLYAPMPILLVGAVYFGVGVLGLQLLLVALVASWNVLNSPQVVSLEVFALQLFLFTTAVPLLCFAAVVSERRRTSTALHASERRVRRQLARLRTIYRAMPIGVAFIDRQMRVVNANHRILSMSNGTMPGEGGADIYTSLPSLAAHLEPLLGEMFRSGEAILDCELLIEQGQKDGPTIDCVVSCVPVRDSFGATIGANVVVQDVTERRRAEQALRESYRQLQESNAKRLDLAGRLISAQEAERRRIARELHDDFSQRLAEIALELGALRNQLNDPGMVVQERVNRARSSTLELSASMRDLSHNLHPAVLKHAGLVAALNSSCTRFGKQQAIEVICHADDVGEVQDEVALTLYRIAQEALSNIARHAQARHVDVKLSHENSSLELTIADDGRGFDPRIVQRHVGLFSAKERARLVNGTVTIESAVGKGTVVRAVVPMLGNDVESA